MKYLTILAFFLAAIPTFADEGDADSAVVDTPVETGAAAQPPAGANGKAKIVYRKRTAVSFDDAVVEGATNNPEGVYVVTPPDKQFGSLLKLRPNFHRELMRDALLLK